MTAVPDLSGNTSGVDAEYAPERDGTPAYPYSVTSASGTSFKTNIDQTTPGTTNNVVLSSQFNSVTPTLTDGQYGRVQLSTFGGVLICSTNRASAADGILNTNNVGMPSHDGTTCLFTVSPHLFNGTSWDRNRKPNAVKRVASSAAGGSPDFAKASAGDVTKISGLNTTAAIIYFHLYNKATAPTVGTDTPAFSYAINANERFDIAIQNSGLYLATGIAYAFTTDIATIPTTGAAAATVTSFALVYA